LIPSSSSAGKNDLINFSHIIDGAEYENDGTIDQELNNKLERSLDALNEGPKSCFDYDLTS
jgi:hypothetical protein